MSCTSETTASMDSSNPSKFVLATNNPNKKEEIMPMFREAGLCLLSPADLGFKIHPTETGSTFQQNAEIKALETFRFLEKNGHGDFFVIADDSGFEVEAMNGLPGVDSALFLGEGTSYETRNAHIVKEMEFVTNRRCRFVSVVCLVSLDGETRFFYGEVVGEVARSVCGMGGFGYDPIFYLPGYKKTMAELGMDEKNRISHRGKAIRSMLEVFGRGETK